MNPFSLRGAWSKGVDFLAGKLAGHALLLIVVVVVVPLVLQYLLAGRVTGLFGPVTGRGESTGATAGGAAGIVTMASFLFQLVGYFGSWRLGLADGEKISGAALYGLIAGLEVAIGGGILILILGTVGALLVPGAVMAIVLVLMMLFLAIFYTLLVALIGVTASVLLAVAMIVGAVTGEVGFAATLVGGSGGVAVLVILAAVLLLWLTARFSCTACLMTARKSLNPVAAIAESWRLTAEEQWRVMGYLALVGVAAALLILAAAAAAAAAGSGLATGFRSAGAAAPGVNAGLAIMGVALTLPLAFLTVMVPAGIYRELATAAPAEVFA